MIPKKMFLTMGAGVHTYRLHSFELALREAGIESCNLVRVSSILPPYCEIIPKEEGIALLQPGQITYCVLSVHRTKRQLQGIGSCVGLAIPKDRSHYGYIAEHHGSEVSEGELTQDIEELALTMLTTTRNGVVSVLPHTNLSNDSVIPPASIDCSVHHICSYVPETQAGLWTTVLTAAVFIDD